MPQLTTTSDALLAALADPPELSTGRVDDREVTLA
jgi:hypothetical protein